MILPFSIALILSVLGLIFFIWNFPRSTVRLFVIPFISKENIDVIFTTDETKVETDKKFILAQKISEEVSASKTAVTTGKTKIGESARGEVIIYNKTMGSKTFPKGTVLQNGTLKFSLDDEVSIASSSDTGEGLAFGKANVPITASGIGPESNLVAASIFIFKDFPESSYNAKNSKSLAGGTSREISSVSKDDQNKLEESLTTELISSAKQQINQQLALGDKIIESSVTNSIKVKKFSADIDTEAQELSLTMTVSVSFISFRQSDLENLSQNTVTVPPAGYILDTGRTSANILETKPDKNGNINSTIALSYYYLPDINTERLKSNISGRTFNQAESYLKSTDQIAGIKIFNDQTLPLFSKRLPFSKKNLQIEISSF